MPNVIEFIFKGTNRSAIRALNEIATQSEKTNRQVKRDAEQQSVSFRKVGESAERTRAMVAGLAGTFGLGGLAFGLKDAVQGGLQLQAQQAQLRAALQSTGQTAGGAYGKLTDFAEKLSGRGGFAATENLQSLTAFVRETHSVTKAQEGLSLATNIARGRNIDLASAQMIVQRAYGGSIGRLQALLGPMVAAKSAAYGLSQAHKEQVSQLTAQSKAMGAAGPMWLKQQELVDGITPKMAALATLQDKQATAQQVIAAAQVAFGGATGAYAGTTQGKVTDLQNSLKTLQERIGMGLLPAVNTLVGGASKLAGWFAKLPEPVQVAVVGFTVVGGALALFGNVLKPFGAIFGGLRGALFGSRGAQEGAAGAAVRFDEAATPAASAVARLGEAANGAASALARIAETGGFGAAVGAEGVATKGAGAVAKEGKVAKLLKVAGKATIVLPLAYGAYKALSPTDHYNPHPAMIGGHPYYRAAGGPIGTDTVPVWATPGEGMLSVRGMQNLARLNAGTMPGGGGPVNLTINLRLPNGKALTQLVLKDVLNKAARGPSNLVGGSIQMGAPGLPS